MCISSSIILVFCFPLNMLFFLYLIFIFYVDEAPFTGSRRSMWLRNLK
jgi:hypothetical protein